MNSLGMRFVPVPGTDVYFSVWETRVKDYQAFCDATGRSWEKSTFPQTAYHPAVNVSWEDATAFCEWLSRTEGKSYRLPTDHEWSCAVGIGDRRTRMRRPRASIRKSRISFRGANSGLRRMKPEIIAVRNARHRRGWPSSRRPDTIHRIGGVIEGFNDGNVFTAAVRSFRPNGFGIYDLGGNVWEWCQDEYEPGSASRVLRGGSCDLNNRDIVLSSGRGNSDPGSRIGNSGFGAVVGAGSGH